MTGDYPPIDGVVTAEQARDLAVTYSNADRAGESWGDVAEASAYFGALAERFPELRDEFEENGIA